MIWIQLFAQDPHGPQAAEAALAALNAKLATIHSLRGVETETYSAGNVWGRRTFWILSPAYGWLDSERYRITGTNGRMVRSPKPEFIARSIHTPLVGWTYAPKPGGLPGTYFKGAGGGGIFGLNMPGFEGLKGSSPGGKYRCVAVTAVRIGGVLAEAINQETPAGNPAQWLGVQPKITRTIYVDKATELPICVQETWPNYRHKGPAADTSCHWYSFLTIDPPLKPSDFNFLLPKGATPMPNLRFRPDPLAWARSLVR